MIDPDAAKFQWGQRVQVIEDLFNDGTYPDWPRDELLVRAGERGEIVQTGTHVETNTRIYLVEFTLGRVVGCLEHEIAEAALEPVGASESQSR